MIKKIIKYKSLKIYCLQLYSKLKNKSDALIILPGLPLSSKEFNFIRENILLFNNLDIFYIIYPGYPQNTKEKFLEINPIKLVDDFINHLKLRKKYKKVFVIGSSFGGSLVLYLKNADRRVSISPVIDWKNLFKGRKGYNYKTFKIFLEKSGYKISDQGWKLLKSGKMFSKLKNIDLKNQLLLVYSSNDPEIDVNNLEQIIKKFNLKAIKLFKKQHLSLRKLRKSTIKKILKWMFLNDNYIYLFKKKLKIVKNLVKKLKQKSAITTLILTGSMATGNIAYDSDIDIICVNSLKKKINFKTDLEVKQFDNTSDLLNYLNFNFRGNIKTIEGKLIFSKNKFVNDFGKLKKNLFKKFKTLLIYALLLELVRLTNYKKIFRYKFGSRWTIKTMIIITSLIEKKPVANIHDILENLVNKKILTPEDINYVREFLNEISQPSYLYNNYYLDYLVKKIQIIFLKFFKRLMVPFFEKRKCKIYMILDKNDTPKFYIKESKIKTLNILNKALYTKNQKEISNIFNFAIKNLYDPQNNIILYFLSCNKNLPEKIKKEIISKTQNYKFTTNIRRNLIEHNKLPKHLLKILVKDMDEKVRHMARLKLKGVDLSKILIRF